MKTILLPIAALIFGISQLSHADDGGSFSFIKTNSGKVYTNCRVFKTDPDGVIIAHQNGGAKLLFADLTPDSRAMLGYDAQKAEAYEKERAEAKKKAREELWKYNCEVAKAHAAAYTAQARRMELITVQNIAGGYGGYGYGYGWDPFGTFGPGYGYGYAYGNGYGYGGPYGKGFGCSPLRYGFVRRGGTTITPQNDCRPANTLVGVIGRSCFPGFNRPSFPVATPAMGRSTPAMGPSTPPMGGGGRR